MINSNDFRNFWNFFFFEGGVENFSIIIPISNYSVFFILISHFSKFFNYQNIGNSSQTFNVFLFLFVFVFSNPNFQRKNLFREFFSLQGFFWLETEISNNLGIRVGNWLLVFEILKNLTCWTFLNSEAVSSRDHKIKITRF